MILHLIILLLASFVLAGFTIHETGHQKFDETLVLIDVSDSNYDNSDEMVTYINTVINNSDANCKVGVIVFGAGKPHLYKKIQNKPKIDVQELFDFYDNPLQDDEGFIMTTGTNMADAIDFACETFTSWEERSTNPKCLSGNRIVIMSDGLETDGNASSAAAKAYSYGAVVDTVYFEPKDYSNTNEVQIENVNIKNQNPKPNQATEVEITVKAHTPGGKVTFKLLDYNAEKPSASIEMNTFTDELDNVEKTYTTSLTFATGGIHTIKVEMTAEIEEEENADGDEDKCLTQNNVYYSYLVVQEKTNKILILNGTSSNDCTELKSLIEEIKETTNGVESNAYTVDIYPQDKAPSNLSDYGEVILVNVNSSGTKSPTRLPNGYDLILKNYAQNGGGVFTLGGENTYYYGGMGTDNFNDILPIKVKPESSTTKEVVLLIDRSSGMCGGEGSWNYSKTRLEVVQEAVVNCLAEGVFNEKDYIGVIFFGGKNYTPIEALKLTSAANIISIKNAVGMDITAIANGKNYLGNTEWRHALEAATKMLVGSKAGDNDHIVMISDGAGDKAEGESAQLTGYPVGGWKVYGATNAGTIPSGVPEKCYTDFILDKYGITTSVINVGCNLSPAKEYLQMMETASELDKKTHYYYTETADDIMKAIEIECKNIPTKIINEDQDFYLALQSSDLQKMCDDENLPVLQGYNGVSLKEGAGATIQTATTKDPIYAEWTYGQGKVGSLMTDITSKWGECLMQQSETREILKYLIKNNFIGAVSGMTSDMNVEFTQKNYTTSITISNINKEGLVPIKDAQGNSVGSVGYITGYYHSPSDKIDPSKTFTNMEDYLNYMCPENASQSEDLIYADGTFIGDFQMMEAGLYVVALLRQDSTGYLLDGFVPPYTYVTFSYSDEYDTFKDVSGAEKMLLGISHAANGTKYNPDLKDLGNEEQNFLSSESTTENRDIDPVFALMLAALLLFILDICARKFHFLWPAEIIRKMRGLPITKEKE